MEVPGTLDWAAYITGYGNALAEMYAGKVPQSQIPYFIAPAIFRHIELVRKHQALVMETYDTVPLEYLERLAE